MTKPKITRAAALEILDYNPETGVFIWKITPKGGFVAAGDVAGYTDLDGYIKIGIKGEYYNAHRLAWMLVTGEWPTDMIDHIDGDRANNAFRNLREASNTINQQNLRKAKSTNKSGLIGVSRKAKCSIARIKVDGKVLYLGSFKTDAEAHEAYLEAKRRLHPGCTI